MTNTDAANTILSLTNYYQNLKDVERSQILGPSKEVKKAERKEEDAKKKCRTQKVAQQTLKMAFRVFTCDLQFENVVFSLRRVRATSLFFFKVFPWHSTHFDSESCFQLIN